jgi:tetratricopeptide (TPR) repeat protein
LHGIEKRDMAPTASELRDELKAIEESWQKMCDDEEQGGSGNGKAMLLLALRYRQCCQKLKVYFATHLQPEQLSEHMKLVDWKVFESHSVCGRDCLKAGAYRDTLKHTQKALDLSDAHGGAWKESAVMNVLYLEMEAWKGLGERTKSLAIAERRAQAMAMISDVTGHDRVAALLNVATMQIEQNDYQAAINTAREALSVEGAPPASRNISRVKLGVALLGLGDGDEALRVLERCEREWSMSGEGMFWSTDALKRDKEILDKTLKRLRDFRADHPKNFPPKQKFSLSEKYTEMREAWDRMTAQVSPPDPKPLLALALRMRQCAEDEMNKSIASPTSDQTTEIALDVDEKIFQAHTRCACECVEAEEYQDALEHTKCAIELSDAWDDLWREKVVRIVLDCEERAFFALGEFSKYVDVAKRRTRGMAALGYSGQALVDELCKIAVVQWKNLCDYVGAVATARAAVALDAPPVSRQYARHTLGTALMAAGHMREAVREFERCESEWTTSIDATENLMSEAELARMRKMLDYNLKTSRLRLAVAEKNVPGGKETMHMLIAGCLDDALAHADDTFKLALMEAYQSRSKTDAMRLPGLKARAFTLASCFLLDDHRASEKLEEVKEILKVWKRESLDDACPICLMPIVWPAPFEVGTRVTVHGLKNTPQHNGSQGVVKRVPSGPDLRAQVDFRSAAPEEGVLTVEERKAVIRGLQQVEKPIGSTQEVSRAAEAILGVPEGSLDQDAVDEVIRDVILRGKKLGCTVGEAIACIEQAITKELARLEDRSATTYSLRIRSANLKASKGHVEASRRALITGCMHVYHARCIKRAVDEGQRTCPVCGDDSHFAETLVECAQMPSWDRPSYVD